jgi:hypothetical protein
MSESNKPPIKTCDYCGKNGYMPTFRDGETLCLACLKVLPETAADGRRKVHEQEQTIKSLTEENEQLKQEVINVTHRLGMELAAKPYSTKSYLGPIGYGSTPQEAICRAVVAGVYGDEAPTLQQETIKQERDDE